MTATGTGIAFREERDVEESKLHAAIHRKYHLSFATGGYQEWPKFLYLGKQQQRVFDRIIQRALVFTYDGSKVMERPKYLGMEVVKVDEMSFLEVG